MHIHTACEGVRVVQNVSQADVVREERRLSSSRGTFITGVQHCTVGFTAKFNLVGRDFTADSITDYD